MFIASLTAASLVCEYVREREGEREYTKPQPLAVSPVTHSGEIPSLPCQRPLLNAVALGLLGVKPAGRAAYATSRTACVEDKNARRGQACQICSCFIMTFSSFLMLMKFHMGD